MSEVNTNIPADLEMPKDETKEADPFVEESLSDEEKAKIDEEFDQYTKQQESRFQQQLSGNLNEQVARVLDLFEPQATDRKIEIVRYLDRQYGA